MEHEEFEEFFSSYKDTWLGCTVAEANEGMKRFSFCFPLSPKKDENAKLHDQDEMLSCTVRDNQNDYQPDDW